MVENTEICCLYCWQEAKKATKKWKSSKFVAFLSRDELKRQQKTGNPAKFVAFTADNNIRPVHCCL